MGAVAFLAVASGALMIYAGFTGQPLVSTVKGIFTGEGASSAKGASSTKPAGTTFSGGGGTFPKNDTAGTTFSGGGGTF